MRTIAIFIGNCVLLFFPLIFAIGGVLGLPDGKNPTSIVLAGIIVQIIYITTLLKLKFPLFLK